MRVLIVEDDPLLAEFVRLAMKEDGHATDTAERSASAQAMAMVYDYDVVILDHMLPDGTGLDVLKHLRSRGKATPVLMLTAKAEEKDIIQGLDSGADDYLTKPFTVGELRARVRALGRRRAHTAMPALSLGDLNLNRLNRTAECGGRSIPLTPKEFSLLEQLLLSANSLVTRTDLLEKVWDLHFDPGSNVVDVHVARLRQKLSRAKSRVKIQTIRGSGFILTEA